MLGQTPLEPAWNFIYHPRVKRGLLLICFVTVCAAIASGCGSKPQYRIEVVAGENSEFVRAQVKVIRQSIDHSLEVPDEIGIASAPDESIFVASAALHRVYKLSPDGKQVTVFAGSGNAGTRFDSTNPTKTDITPDSITVMSDGSVVIGDNGFRLLAISADGRRIKTLVVGSKNRYGSYQVRTTSGKEERFDTKQIAALPNQTIAVATVSTVLKISENGKRIVVAAGGGRVGRKERDQADKNKIPLDENHPTNNAIFTDLIAALPSGALLIRDFYRYKVLKLSADGGRITTYAGAGRADVTSQPSKLDVEAPAALAGLPDGSGLIATLRRIFKITPDDKTVELIAGGAKKEGAFDPNDPTNTYLRTQAGSMPLTATKNGSILAIANGYLIYRISPVH